MSSGWRIVVISFILIGLVLTPSLSAEAAIYDCNGPWIDKVHATLIEDGNQQVEALLDDDIDLIGNMLDPMYLSELQDAQSIEVAETPRNGYGYLSINTEKYPLSITAFRRAFAFALNKTAISNIVWQGSAEPLDSCVPKMNPYSIEGDLSYSYYDADIATANDLLDDAGFIDVDDDGWREAPDVSNFDVLIEVSQVVPTAVQVATYAENALHSIGIDALAVETDFFEYLNRFYWYGDYDVVLMGRDFPNMDVDWLGYSYWGDYSDVPGWNLARFDNETFDSWRDQLLKSVNPDEVREAAEEMQKIWIYECPEIVCYENNIFSAYRTDKFEGFVEDISSGVPGWWTYYKAQLQDALGGPYGGTLRTTMPYDIHTFNFMMMPTDYPLQGMLYMMYDSLLKPGPDGVDLPWLAESYLVETHADNPSVPEGSTQVTFEIRQNVTWSDGTPLTADDVSYSINYYREMHGPFGPDLRNMTQAVMMTPYKVRFRFDTESIWHLHAITYKPILPKHIFVSEIGYDGWDEWSPLPVDETLVTSGPFILEQYVNGSHVTLEYNENYFFGTGERPGITNPTGLLPMESLLIAAGVTIVVIVIFIKRR